MEHQLIKDILIMSGQQITNDKACLAWLCPDHFPLCWCKQEITNPSCLITLIVLGAPWLFSVHSCFPSSIHGSKGDWGALREFIPSLIIITSSFFSSVGIWRAGLVFVSLFLFSLIPTWPVMISGESAASQYKTRFLVGGGQLHEAACHTKSAKWNKTGMPPACFFMFLTLLYIWKWTL